MDTLYSLGLAVSLSVSALSRRLYDELRTEAVNPRRTTDANGTKEVKLLTSLLNFRIWRKRLSTSRVSRWFSRKAGLTSFFVPPASPRKNAPFWLGLLFDGTTFCL